MEQLNYNLLFRWFVGLDMDAAVWVPTVFTKMEWMPPPTGPAAGVSEGESPLEPDGIEVPRWKFHPREGQGGLPMECTIYGLDLAKRVMQLHWIDTATGEIHRRQLRRRALLEFFATCQPGLVAMEACGSAHY